MNEFARMFKALGNPTRLRIFLMLKHKKLCVCEIKQIIGCSMATLSNHLKILKNADLIFFTKEKKYINYLLNRKNSHVEKLLKMMTDFNDEEIEKDKQMVTKVDRKNICG